MTGDPALEHALRRIADLEERVARLEAGGPGAASDPLVPSAYVRELVAMGQKIAAFDEYRNRTGVGLKEAKRRIDAIGG